jgi:hypothetical protein
MFVSKEKSPMKNILYSIYPFINSSTYKSLKALKNMGVTVL